MHFPPTPTGGLLLTVWPDSFFLNFVLRLELSRKQTQILRFKTWITLLGYHPDMVTMVPEAPIWVRTPP